MTEDELVDTYVGLVKWVAARRVPARDYQDACQDGLLGIVQAHRKFDHELGGDWYDQWIRLAVERSIIDGHRRRTGNRHGTRPPPVSIETVIADELASEPVRLGDTFASDDTADDTVIAERLEAWLRALPFADQTDRRVLDGMLDGMLLQDIAAAEGVTPGRISQRVRRIREVVARRM